MSSISCPVSYVYSSDRKTETMVYDSCVIRLFDGKFETAPATLRMRIVNTAGRPLASSSPAGATGSHLRSGIAGHGGGVDGDSNRAGVARGSMTQPPIDAGLLEDLLPGDVVAGGVTDKTMTVVTSPSELTGMMSKEVGDAAYDAKSRRTQTSGRHNFANTRRKTYFVGQV
ncbi:unnamed protein product [Protopolystoma xenopodis]|uniref:Uncharacterized protein n=1 Tax=Protopolystoma xenopodis TaxID=117903 RepID=A0A448XT24_9PLAT|nr:unnamed protein product [Protopolystoma xenopodis]